MTTTQLKRELREKGVDMPEGATTDELRVLLEQARKQRIVRAREAQCALAATSLQKIWRGRLQARLVRQRIRTHFDRKMADVAKVRLLVQQMSSC